MSNDLGRAEFLLLVIASLKEGKIQEVDRTILRYCADRMQVGQDRVRTVFADFSSGRFPPMTPLNQKQRMKILRVLISVVVSRVDLDTAHDELDLVARVGSCFGLSKQRIKSMIQGANERHDPTSGPPESRRFR